MPPADALPDPEQRRDTTTARGTRQRSWQEVVTRPGHHLHRTLHRNINGWALADASFELRALHIGKS